MRDGIIREFPTNFCGGAVSETERACSVCGALTWWACADCAETSVCEAPACRVAHMAVCPPLTLDAAIRDELMRRELAAVVPS